MNRDINPFGLRLPSELKEKLQQEAEKKSQSLNREIVDRLQQSFDLEAMNERHFKAIQMMVRLENLRGLQKRTKEQEREFRELEKRFEDQTIKV